MPLDAGRRLTPGEAAPAVSIAALETVIGRIGLHWQATAEDAGLVRVVLAADDLDAPPAPAWLAAPFMAYFADALQPIGLPTRLPGTAFQRRVWRAIAAIAPGRTRTYGELAADLGSAARAVGGACRANPCPLVVPCHRVVARQGLGGFAGDRGGRLLVIKRALLAHEGIACRWPS